MSTTAPRPRAPHRLATAIWTLAVPLVLAAVALVIAASWRDRLPDPIAIHWGTGGVDGFGTFWPHVLVPLAGLVPLFSLGFWALGTFLGHDAMPRRLAAGMAVWTSVFVATMTLTTLWVQLDLDDAALAGDVGAGMAIGFVAGTALGAIAAWLMPGDPPQPTTAPVGADAPRLDLADGERATWVESVAQRGIVWIGVTLVTTFGVTGLLTRQWWIPVAFLAVLLPAILALSAFTVIVDHRGLSVDSRLGWPRRTIPLDEIEQASARDVSPLREFGGWGMRTAVDGTTGVVLRQGPAIIVERTGGRRYAVTVDDAETGAALLNTLASRTR